MITVQENAPMLRTYFNFVFYTFSFFFFWLFAVPSNVHVRLVLSSTAAVRWKFGHVEFGMKLATFWLYADNEILPFECGSHVCMHFVFHQKFHKFNSRLVFDAISSSVESVKNVPNSLFCAHLFTRTNLYTRWTRHDRERQLQFVVGKWEMWRIGRICWCTCDISMYRWIILWRRRHLVYVQT